jgi:hypothetical protein
MTLMWQKAISAGTSLDPEVARVTIRNQADRRAVAPLDSPTSTYSFDAEREGILWAPNAVQ